MISHSAVSNILGMQSRSTTQREMKKSATKVRVSGTDVIEMYNQGMGGVDLVDQRTAAYHIHRKSSISYLRSFFRIDGCSLCQRLHRL